VRASNQAVETALALLLLITGLKAVLMIRQIISELHSPGFADHVLVPRRIPDDDLAHRNWTNASRDAQIRSTMSIC